MPYELDRLRPTLAADSDVLPYAAFPQGPGETQLAEVRVDPITVPHPQPFDTVTIGVVTGRPLKLEFTVNEVQTREVVRDDLILGFENGGKIILKDYMHAFGLLGDQRTTIIQPDGKHYAFTELLAPTAGAKPEAPESGTAPNVVIIQKPAPGETEHFKLSAEKPMALNFGMNDIARSEVNKDGDLVVTFKDRAVLVLEGYAALKDHADIAIYFAKGDKVSLADLAPGAGPDTGAEGGHLFTQFEPGGSIGALDHLGPLGPEPASLIPPPGPPESPPPLVPPPEGPPPELPPPPIDCKPPPDYCPPPPPPPPVDCKPPPKDCAPPPPCEPPSKHDAHHPKDHGGHDKHDGEGHGTLTWIVAAGIDVGGDVEGVGGRWGDRARDSGHALRHETDAGRRGWIHGHDDAAHSGAQHMLGASHDHLARGWDPQGDADGDWHSRGGESGPLGGKHDHDAAGGHHQAGLHGSGLHKSAHAGHEGHGAPMTSKDVFDSGHGAPAPSHAGAGGGAFATAHDFAAVTAHAESHAPHIQNAAHHNVMGHG